MSSLLRSTKYILHLYRSANRITGSKFHNTKPLIPTNYVVLQDYSTFQRLFKKKGNLESLMQKLNSNIRSKDKITIRDINEVLAAIKFKNDITSIHSLVLIQCCGNLLQNEMPEQKTLLVQKIWNHLTELRVPIDVSHYNALLKVYLDNDHSFAPSKFLEDMDKHGLQPNRVTYQRIIWKYCHKGELEEATQILNKMKDLNMPVTEPVLNAFVMGHALNGDIDGAKGMIDMMERAGLSASNDTYTLLACGYARKGDISGIEDVITITKCKDILLTDRDILCIIKNLIFGGHDDMIERIIPHLTKDAGYNREAKTVIYELLQRGFESSARKVLTTLSEPTKSTKESKGVFYINKLVKLDKPADEIIMLIRKLHDENLAPTAISSATIAALSLGKTKLALKLFKELRKDGYEVREHYYWPLLAQKCSARDEKGLLKILWDMYSCSLIASGETSEKFILPCLFQHNTPQNVISKLQNVGMPRNHIVRIVFKHLLEMGDIKAASDVVPLYPPGDLPIYVRSALLRALKKSKDIESFIQILHMLCAYVETYDGNSEVYNGDKCKEIGDIVKLAVDIVANDDLGEKLLAAALSKGLRIDTDSAKAIEQSLGKNMTENISTLLSQLTAPDLKVTPIENLPKYRAPRAQITDAQLDGLSDGDPKLYARTLNIYIQNGNIEQISELVEKFKSNNIDLSTITMLKLYELYCINGLVDKANDIKAQFEARNIEFRMDNDKKVLMAIALIKSNRYDDAVEHLKRDLPTSTKTGTIINNYVKKMLDILVAQKDESKVKELATVLLANSYVAPSSFVLGPLVKVYILKGDIDKALEEFETCSTRYKCTPMQNTLMKALIDKEDVDKLQWLTDVSSQIHGEVNTLYDVMLAFIECGRILQARRILQKLNLNINLKRFEHTCKRYAETNKTEYLEGLLEATKGQARFDRTVIFYELLNKYCKANETDKALGLWQTLQEESILPSSIFLRKLGNHLKENKMEVPFVIPDEN